MKYTRIFFALIVIAAIVLVAPGAVGAWNNRVQQSPVAANPQGGPQAPRPLGTVIGSPQAPLTADECSVLSSYCITAKEEGLAAEALTELPDGLSLPEGENVVLTRVVKIDDTTGANGELESDLEFTLEPALEDGEKVAYWDGTEWVEPKAVDGKFVVPAGTKLPIILAVFTD